MNASQVTGTGHDYDILENFDAPQYECYDVGYNRTTQIYH